MEVTDTNTPAVDASPAGSSPGATAQPAVEARRLELRRAVEAVPGVVGAKVVAGKDTRHRLRVRLAPGEDVARARAAIATTLNERFGIDVSARDVRVLAPDVPPMRVHTPTAPVDEPDAAAGQADGAWASRGRAGLVSAEIHAGPVETDVIVVLQNGGVRASQRVRVVSVDSMVWRAVADATLAALRDLTEQQLLAAVDEVWLDPADDPFTATVVVRAITPRGEVGTVGSALVAGDERTSPGEVTTTTAGSPAAGSRGRIGVAVARATLAAVNRQVESMLAAARRSSR